MASILKGFYYFFSGIGLMFKPGIFRFALWPLLINSIVFILLGALAYFQFGELLEKMLSYLPGWLDWLRYLLWPLFALTLAVVSFFTFTLVANLIAAPFNGPLANAVERRLGRVNGNDASSRFVRSVMQSVISELRKLVYIIVRALPLLLLFVVPVINIAAPVLWFLYSAWMLAMEYADYPMGNHELDFKTQLAYLKHRRMLTLGFGAAVTLAMLVPLLNFLVMPAAVAGASKMWVEELSAARPKSA